MILKHSDTRLTHAMQDRCIAEAEATYRLISQFLCSCGSVARSSRVRCWSKMRVWLVFIGLAGRSGKGDGRHTGIIERCVEAKKQ